MNKIFLFFIVFLLSSYALSNNFERVSYPLFGEDNHGYLLFNVDYSDMNSNGILEKVKIANQLESKKRSVTLNEYNGAWSWSNFIIISAEYSKAGKTFSWRDSYLNTGVSVEIVEVNFSQLFEISYMKILSKGLDVNNSVELKRMDSVIEAYVAYETPSSSPSYTKIDKSGVALWVLGVKKINSEITKNKNSWEQTEGSSEIGAYFCLP